MIFEILHDIHTFDFTVLFAITKQRDLHKLNTLINFIIIVRHVLHLCWPAIKVEFINTLVSLYYYYYYYYYPVYNLPSLPSL